MSRELRLFLSDWGGHAVRAFVLLCLFAGGSILYAMCMAFL